MGQLSAIASEVDGLLVVSVSLPWRTLRDFSEGNLPREERRSSKPKGFGRQEIDGILPWVNVGCDGVSIRIDSGGTWGLDVISNKQLRYCLEAVTGWDETFDIM